MRLTIRLRLLLSLVLPVALLVPLAGLTFIYVLENNLIFPTLATEMIDQGLLVSRLTRDHPMVWNSPPEAQSLLDSITFQRPSRIGLLTPGHVLIATSQPNDLTLVGSVLPNLTDPANSADSWWAVTPGMQPGEQFLDVMVPVRDEKGQTIGLVRIYRRITDIQQDLTTLRLVVVGGLLLWLTLSSVTALWISGSFGRPLKRLAHTIAEAPLEGEAHLIPEVGDDEIKALAHAHNRLQQRRQELEENRQAMLANLVHEIGRPLGSLRTAIHALQAGAADNPALRSDLLNGMSERIHRIGRLLEDLSLTYRRLSPQEIHLKEVDLVEWLNPLASLWAEDARQKPVTWIPLVEGDLPVIQTDPDRLAQALSNLVNNAIKFTPPGGTVTLAVRQEGGQVLFQVSDSGPGIPLADQTHLFTPFYRSVQPGWKAPGLGLGLSIARTLVSSLGGSMAFQSAPGQGSTFTIRIPLY
jgi:two-component system, OmpR family, sensor histidine kinase BaeS